MNAHFPFCLLLCGIAFLAILSGCAAKPQSLPDVSSASDSETLQEASQAEDVYKRQPMQRNTVLTHGTLPLWAFQRAGS